MARYKLLAFRQGYLTGESPWFDVMNDRYDTLLPKGAARSPARPGNRCTWSSSTNTPTSRPPLATRNSKPNSRHHRCIPRHQGAQIPQHTFRSKRDCAYDGELATVTICRRDCSAGHRKLYHILRRKTTGRIPSGKMLLKQVHFLQMKM